MPTEVIREISQVTASGDARPTAHAGEQRARQEVTTCRPGELPKDTVPAGDGKLIDLSAKRAARSGPEIGKVAGAKGPQTEVAAGPVSGKIRPIELRPAQAVKPVIKRAA